MGSGLWKRVVEKWELGGDLLWGGVVEKFGGDSRGKEGEF